jgi:hypothetical protein
MSNSTTAIKSVVAKFKCEAIRETEYHNEVEMSPVYSQSGENKDFTDVTPYGKFTMGMTKDSAAASFFEPGKEYYFTIREAPANVIQKQMNC